MLKYYHTWDRSPKSGELEFIPANQRPTPAGTLLPESPVTLPGAPYNIRVDNSGAVVCRNVT